MQTLATFPSSNGRAVTAVLTTTTARAPHPRSYHWSGFSPCKPKELNFHGYTTQAAAIRAAARKGGVVTYLKTAEERLQELEGRVGQLEARLTH